LNDDSKYDAQRKSFGAQDSLFIWATLHCIVMANSQLRRRRDSTQLSASVKSRRHRRCKLAITIISLCFLHYMRVTCSFNLRVATKYV